MKTVIIHLMTGGGARLGYEGADAPCAWPWSPRYGAII